jgi:hypothetical protein
MVLLDFKVVLPLKAQPKPFGGGEIAREPEGRISCYNAVAMDNLIDAPGRHTNLFGQTVLADSQWLQKLFEQNFARMDRR